MSKKVKYRILEICLMVIGILFSIICFITLLTPNKYEDLNRSWLSQNGKENYEKYNDFEDKRWDIFIPCFAIIGGSFGACIVIELNKFWLN